MSEQKTKRRKPTRGNTETFKERVFELVGDDYTFHGEYTRTKDHMEVTHNKCGREYEVTPSNFLGGVRCRKCMYRDRSVSYTKTHEQFMSDLKDVHGTEYEPLQKYTGVFDRLDFKHTICGKTWRTTPSIILGGSECINCHGKIYDDNTFKTKLHEVVGDEFTPLEKYKNSRIKMKVIHNVCGNEFESTASNLIQFNSCPYCDQKRPQYDKDRFMKEFEKTVSNDYEIIGDYTLKTNTYKFKHNRCGRTFESTGSDMLRGRGCTHCKMSTGEESIARYLESIDVDFESEYRIDECRNLIPLPFDFAVFKDDKLFCLIEFEGEQHYRSIKTWGGDEGLANRQKNDKIKRDYCMDNDIKFIEIPYWDQDNVDKILNGVIYGGE